MSDYEERFGGIGRLYGAEGLARLRRSHVCVIGIGGVGCWAVESLVRSGVGKLTLVDLDEVCISNVNRQLPALTGTIGKPKIEMMAERARLINPECELILLQEFFSPVTAERILATQFDYVIDAIDSLSNKCLLIARCRDKSIPMITCGGAGGRRDPSQIRVTDLARASHDRLFQAARKKLRTKYDFPRRPGKLFHIECVYSPELVVYPHKDGTVCRTIEITEEDENPRLNCNLGLGSASFVTGAFGFAAAARAVLKITNGAPVQVGEG